MTTTTRTIKVAALSRVEGEGGMTVQLHGSDIERVELRIFEPPRFFEAFLRGRSPLEVPDIVARICGICPVAYQMSAVHALEQSLDVTITPEIRRLRRLLYCGEWIESHGLHMHLLHAPDFLGCESGLQAAERFPQEVRRGLRLKKYGNELLEVLGGRAIHPINVAIGGFHRLPRRSEFERLIPHFEWGVEAAIAATRWVAGFDFPEFNDDYDFVSVSHPDEYPLNEGTIVSSRGGEWTAQEYESAFEEFQVPHSTALQSVVTHTESSSPRSASSECATDAETPSVKRRWINERSATKGSAYSVGPLARVNLCFDRLSPLARRTADEIGFTLPCLNPFRMIIARGLELIHVYEEALEILREYREPSIAKVPVTLTTGEGCSATEAPRGLLYHRYQCDEAGLISLAKIVPPTSQNQSRIEHDLADWLPRVMSLSDDAIARSCEKVIRNYDPCISCSTHFLRITWQRG